MKIIPSQIDHVRTLFFKWLQMVLSHVYVLSYVCLIAFWCIQSISWNFEILTPRHSLRQDEIIRSFDQNYHRHDHTYSMWNLDTKLDLKSSWPYTLKIKFKLRTIRFQSGASDWSVQNGRTDKWKALKIIKKCLKEKSA